MKAKTSSDRAGMRSGLALLLACLPLAAGAQGEAETVVSRSSQLALTAQDYADHFVQMEPADRKKLGENPKRLEDFVLDFHSDTALAAKAERLELDQDPLVKSLLESARRRILVGALMKQVYDNAEPPDFEALARERYAAQKETYRLPEKRKVAHILIKPVSECAPAEGEQKKTAEELLAELEAGADFAELARKYSDDRASAEAGGLIDEWIPKNSKRLVPAFRDEAFLIEEPGGLSPPVRTRFGIHIIKLLEVEEGRIPPYDEVKPRIIAKLEQEYRNSLLVQERAEAYPNPDTIAYKTLRALLSE